MSTPTHHNEGRQEGYETRDVNVRGVTLLAGVLLAAVALAMVLTFALFDLLEVREDEGQAPPASLAGRAVDLPPEPRLQAHPTRPLEEMRAEEDERLRSWYWVDREAGTVGMPIEQAMERVVARGLPARPEPRDGAGNGGSAP